jgi:hypothetical protein
MGVSDQRHAPAALCARERTPCTHWIGGWLGLKAVWTQRLEGNFFASTGDGTPVIQSDTILTDLP